MKKESIIFFILLISLFINISSTMVIAEDRSIYVGDLINIKLSGEEITENELRTAFTDFEIVNIKNEADGYLITFRCFEIGEKTVKLGNKDMVIVVKSTLDEIDRDTVFEGNLNPEESAFFIPCQYVFYSLILIFISTGCITLVKFIKKKKLSALSPYAYFLNQILHMTLYGDDCFVKMTLAFKQYLESNYSFLIRGKTSTEIIGELKYLAILDEFLSDIEAWMEKSDYYKFTSIAVSDKEKQVLLDQLIALVEKIEGSKEVAHD